MIVMLNLVLIDVISIVSFTVYGSTCATWDCTHVLWVDELYITSCVLNLSLQFLYIRCFGECEPFFIWKGIFFFSFFLQKPEQRRTKYSITASTVVVDQVKHPECSSPLFTEREWKVFWGVHVFEFKALYVCFFFHIALFLFERKLLSDL